MPDFNRYSQIFGFAIILDGFAQLPGRGVVECIELQKLFLLGNDRQIPR